MLDTCWKCFQSWTLTWDVFKCELKLVADDAICWTLTWDVFKSQMLEIII